MNDVDYLNQNKTERLFLKKHVERKALGVHQQGNFVLNQTADVQQLLKVKNEEQVPSLCNSSLDQQDPELLIIKKEDEKLWSSQEGEQLPVKSEDDEKPQLLQLHQIQTKDNRETEPPTSSSAEQMKTETDGEDCGGPEPDSNHDPNTDQKASDILRTEDSDDYNEDDSRSGSESENEDSDEDWRETRTSGSGVRSKVGHKNAKKSFSCSACFNQFAYKQSLQKHMISHSGEISSSLVDKKHSRKKKYVKSQKVNAKDKSLKKLFACVECGKT